MELKEISDALDRIEGKMKDTSEANKAEASGRRAGETLPPADRSAAERRQGYGSQG